MMYSPEGVGFLLKALLVSAVLIGAPTTVRVTWADQCALIQEPIEPCTCSVDILDCSGVESAQQLLDIPGLQASSGRHFRTIMILNNPNITEIPERAFGDHSSGAYSFQNNRMLSIIHPDFFSNSSVDEVNNLVIVFNAALVSIPFDTVKKLNSLKSLYLFTNHIKTIPVSAFYNASQALQNITLHANLINFIGPNAFNGLPNLNYLGLFRNEIPVLNRDSLAFEGEAPTIILSDNLLWRFVPDFIHTLPRTNGRVLDLKRNLIEKLDEKVWRPILERSLEPPSADQPVQPKVEINRNPIICDCQMYWLYQMKEAESIFGGTLNCNDEIGDLWLHHEAHFQGCH